MLTDKEINDAKIGFKYQHPSDILHEHEDCIRMAYEWLDAQTTIKTKPKHSRALKHIIEKWAGRYISDAQTTIKTKPKHSRALKHIIEKWAGRYIS
ncbi:hypothetical protein, partial [Gluconobacter sp. P5H9_a]|uniref:hypothetical protein n=1 Tax=Gluconobacter sp. P5H9_a TaxID=2762616 RepID=UPI001C04D25D